MMDSRKFTAPAFMTAALLIMVPALDWLQAVWPMRPSEASWRVIAVGLTSRVLITPLLGLLMAHALALYLNSRSTLRALAVLNAFVALLFIAALGIFALDALQVRTSVAPLSRDTYELGVLMTIAKLVLALPLIVVLAISEWRRASEIRRHSRTERPALLRERGLREPLAESERQLAETRPVQ